MSRKKCKKLIYLGSFSSSVPSMISALVIEKLQSAQIEKRKFVNFL